MVSIHAPARGATRLGQLINLSGVVSIHAPARGATKYRKLNAPMRKSFNPRARAGRDVAGYAMAAAQSGFNPRARAGRDEK